MIKDNKNHLLKKWEVSIMEVQDNGARFKVTRRVPEMGVAETRMCQKPPVTEGWHDIILQATPSNWWFLSTPKFHRLISGLRSKPPFKEWWNF